MSVVDWKPILRKYELGAPMDADEKEILMAGLYFYWRSQNRPAAGKQREDGK